MGLFTRTYDLSRNLTVTTPPWTLNHEMDYAERHPFEFTSKQSYRIPMDMRSVSTAKGQQEYETRLRHMSTSLEELAVYLEKRHNLTGLADQVRLKVPGVKHHKEKFLEGTTVIYWSEETPVLGPHVTVYPKMTRYMGSVAQSPAQIFADIYIRRKSLNNEEVLPIDCYNCVDADNLVLHSYAAGAAMGYQKFGRHEPKKNEWGEVNHLAGETMIGSQSMKGVYQLMWEWLEGNRDPLAHLQQGFHNRPGGGGVKYGAGSPPPAGGGFANLGSPTRSPHYMPIKNYKGPKNTGPL